jgi:hypothetical protein
MNYYCCIIITLIINSVAQRFDYAFQKCATKDERNFRFCVPEGFSRVSQESSLSAHRSSSVHKFTTFLPNICSLYCHFVCFEVLQVLSCEKFKPSVYNPIIFFLFLIRKSHHHSSLEFQCNLRNILLFNFFFFYLLIFPSFKCYS